MPVTTISSTAWRASGRFRSRRVTSQHNAVSASMMTHVVTTALGDRDRTDMKENRAGERRARASIGPPRDAQRDGARQQKAEKGGDERARAEPRGQAEKDAAAAAMRASVSADAEPSQPRPAVNR